MRNHKSTLNFVGEGGGANQDFQKQEPTDRKGFDFKFHVRSPFCVAMVLAKELSLEK